MVPIEAGGGAPASCIFLQPHRLIRLNYSHMRARIGHAFFRYDSFAEIALAVQRAYACAGNLRRGAVVRRTLSAAMRGDVF